MTRIIFDIFEPRRRVAAESREMRIRHAQRSPDRDGRFDRIAARAQHVAAGLARKLPFVS
jgi:hypothetical protein